MTEPLRSVGERGESRGAWALGLGGAVFGACFPLVAWCLDIWVHDLELELRTIARLHSLNPVHTIVDLAPLVLGLAGLMLGRREERIVKLNASLERRIEARTGELRAALEETERTRGELEVAKTEAERALLTRTRFLAAMSHELRTPMVGIVGWLELVEGGRLDASQRRAVGVARRSADALLGIVGSVLDLSKIESGNLELEAAPFRPAQTLEAVIDLLLPTAARKNIELELVVDPALRDTWFRSDGKRLMQVLTNLAGNAVKFTAQGGVTLELRRSGSRLRFEVRDTGIGIDEDALPRIFEPFVQAAASTTREYGGTGLGLTIARDIVRALGGRLELKSAVGLGSTFVFELELEAVPAPAEAEAQAGGTALEDRPRVLVVDDNALTAEVTMAQLGAIGAEATWAASGAAAIEALLDERWDLVLMDQHMPEMDGIETTRRVRAAERGRRTPIVALSASALASEIEAGEAAGMDDRLVKPVRLAELGEAIERHLRRPRGGPTIDAPEGPRDKGGG